MKKLCLNPNNAVYMAIVSAITLVWVITLFLLGMWYDKNTVRVANTNYVREVTKWPGHTHVSHLPVEYTELSSAAKRGSLRFALIT